MEDAYSFVIDFAGVRGQGFFAIFDGHAGPEAAEWCGNHFHERFLSDLKENPEMSIPDVMNKTFLAVDHDLSNLSEDRGLSSGCTAVTAFLRLEDPQGNQTFLQNQSSFGDLSAASSTDETSTDLRMADPLQDLSLQREKKSNSGRGGFRNAVRSLATSVTRSRPSSPAPSSTPRSSSPNTQHPPLFETSALGLRRVLYTANAGDARAVLSRAGKAVRLTYDHKGADKQEAKRIQDAGGFVLNNRVNGRDPCVR
jgi:protein phosphatase PTC1